MGKYTLGAVTVAERVNRHVLEGHHIEIYLLVVLVRSVVVGGELTELFDLFLCEMNKKSHGLMKERVYTRGGGKGSFSMHNSADCGLLTSSCK